MKSKGSGRVFSYRDHLARDPRGADLASQRKAQQDEALRRQFGGDYPWRDKPIPETKPREA